MFYLDPGDPKGHRLNGGLSETQCPGNLDLLHVTCCLGQEVKALEKPRGESSTGCPARNSGSPTSTPEALQKLLLCCLDTLALDSHKRAAPNHLMGIKGWAEKEASRWPGMSTGQPQSSSPLGCHSSFWQGRPPQLPASVKCWGGGRQDGSFSILCLLQLFQMSHARFWPSQHQKKPGSVKTPA